MANAPPAQVVSWCAFCSGFGVRVKGGRGATFLVSLFFLFRTEELPSGSGDAPVTWFV